MTCVAGIVFETTTREGVLAGSATFDCPNAVNTHKPTNKVQMQRLFFMLN